MHLEKLLAISSAPLGGQISQNKSIEDVQGISLKLREQLQNLLRLRNGFLAFEGALHVLHVGEYVGGGDFFDIASWNSTHLWRSNYSDATQDLIFFAEDVFGGQFAIGEDGIYTFEPETAEKNLICADLEGWAQQILADYAYLTGYPVAHQWQCANGAIPKGSRLLPKIPFFLGGLYESENLIPVPADVAMKYRADMWRQVKDLPEGAQIQLLPLPEES